MTIPLMILALLSLIGGWVGIPAALGGHNEFEHFLDPVFAVATAPEAYAGATQVSHTIELLLAFISVCVALIGLALAAQFYYRKPGSASALAAKSKPLYSLLDHKYWVDEIYGALIVTPLLAISRLLLGGLFEHVVVEGAPAAAAGGARGLGWIVRRMQSGNIRSYAGWLALGAAAFLLVSLFLHGSGLR